MIDEQWNNEVLSLDRDTIDERHEAALIYIKSYQQSLPCVHAKKTHVRKFKPGNKALRKIFQNTRVHEDGKLAPNREGPYTIVAAFDRDAYLFADVMGRRVLNP